MIVALLATGLWLGLGGLGNSAYACGTDNPGEAREPGTSSTPPGDFRAFSEDSYWNTPLPDDAPVDDLSDEWIRYLTQDASTNFIEIAGADGDGRWGHPIYFSRDGDPACNVVNSCEYRRPEEFDSVRIPEGASQDPTSDAAMTVYDLDKGIVYGFYQARYSSTDDEWSACGGTVYYLDSNGLEGSLPQSDDERNFGHRGVPPPTYAVRHDEIESGVIKHVLKIAVDTAHEEYAWPMTGSDGDTRAPLAPLEGARIRLKPEIDLDSYDLTRAERTIATALQRYGAVIGDQSGSTTVLKVESTVVEGRGQLWTGILNPNSLDMFLLDDYEFVRLDYGS